MATSGTRYMLGGDSMYTIDGTPFARSSDADRWAVIGSVSCLFAWQRGEIVYSTSVLCLYRMLAGLHMTA